MNKQMKIRGLSLTRPWSFAFLNGPADEQKRVENRSWFPKAGMMGHFIALQSAKSYSESDRLFISRVTGLEVPTQGECPYGQIFAVCRVVAVVTGILDPRLAEGQKKWFFGPFGWLFDDFVPLAAPVNCSGAQQLWELPEAVRGPLRDVYRASVPGGLFPTEPVLWEHPAAVQRRLELSDYERRLQD